MYASSGVTCMNSPCMNGKSFPFLFLTAWDPGHAVAVSSRYDESPCETLMSSWISTRNSLALKHQHGHPQISRSPSRLSAKSGLRSHSLPFAKHTDHPKALCPNLHPKHHSETTDGHPHHPKSAHEIHPIKSDRTILRIGQEGMAAAMDR